MTGPEVVVIPEIVLAAAAELDALAGRLEVTAATAAPLTHVVPAGSEEVSVLASTYFNRAAATHDTALAAAIAELHFAANTLRTQVASYIAEDLANAATIAATVV
ncbi:MULTISPECIES: PE family protein [Antrihabitans]|jgi:hypothetical protein|uniref:PE family protein n=2 Tax=Antrihabitans TaxID=2799491 RepID=A0A934U4J4_9NOCA|nr:PE family protein [Antrihabitans stalagmiti]MBJ8339873.1 PE family protein [Antrihabitans stalagmiti]